VNRDSNRLPDIGPTATQFDCIISFGIGICVFTDDLFKMVFPNC